MISSIQQILANDFDGFFLISGPCAIESEEITFETAQSIKNICNYLEIPFVFKASFKKANRTKMSSFVSIGEDKALKILRGIKDELDIAITTDVHECIDIEKIKGWLDIIQIPAFLSRQTELICAAAKVGVPVNIKKGQFMSAESMSYAAEKVKSTGNNSIFFTERGNSFGYQDLVVDFRNIPRMSDYCNAVIMDCTHSTQRPNNKNGVTGGNPDEVENIAKAALAVGAKGLFIETHPSPSSALSDGANMLPLNKLEPMLARLKRLSTKIDEIYGKNH